MISLRMSIHISRHTRSAEAWRAVRSEQASAYLETGQHSSLRR